MKQKYYGDGSPCPSDCGGTVWWQTGKEMYACDKCSEEYWHLLISEGGIKSKCRANCKIPADQDFNPVHERPIAYIAGALNDASCAYIQNVRNMILWADKIRALGYAVFIPGIDLLCGIACSGWKYDDYFNNSQPFLAKADIVFVCPGWENSKGTKRELETAASLGVPVYYGDDGYKRLQIKKAARDNVSTPFEECSDEELGERRENLAGLTSEECNDEESARDRRRPVVVHGPFVHDFAPVELKDDVRELNDEALAELKRRIADSPFRKGTDVRLNMKPYMRADEGTCDDHVGPGVPVQDKISLQDKVVCEQCKRFYVGPISHDTSDDNAVVNKPKFIEEANNHNIIGYLKYDPHPEYRVVSVIPMPHASASRGAGAGTGAARFHTYIWELKDDQQDA